MNEGHSVKKDGHFLLLSSVNGNTVSWITILSVRKQEMEEMLNVIAFHVMLSTLYGYTFSNNRDVLKKMFAFIAPSPNKNIS